MENQDKTTNIVGLGDEVLEDVAGGAIKSKTYAVKLNGEFIYFNSNRDLAISFARKHEGSVVVTLNGNS